MAFWLITPLRGIINPVNTIYFATTNKDKIQIAQTVCSEVNLVVNPVSLEIDEKELAELEKQASDVETRQTPVQLNEQA